MRARRRRCYLDLWADWAGRLPSADRLVCSLTYSVSGNREQELHCSFRLRPLQRPRRQHHCHQRLYCHYWHPTHLASAVGIRIEHAANAKPRGNMTFLCVKSGKLRGRTFSRVLLAFLCCAFSVLFFLPHTALAEAVSDNFHRADSNVPDGVNWEHSNNAGGCSIF